MHRDGLGAPAAQTRHLDNGDLAALCLFVVQHLCQHLFPIISSAGGQAEAAVHRAHPLLQCLGFDHGQHAQSHALAVVKAHGAAALDALDGLDAVADGVAEVQGLAHALLSLVLLHDVLLEPQAAADDLADLGIHVAIFKDREQLGVCQQAGLDGFCQTVDEVAAGQGGKGVRIHDDELGLPESAHDVFGIAQIHGGLAADGGIDHGKGGGGAVDEVDAPHVDGSGKTGQIAHHAAAHGDH